MQNESCIICRYAVRSRQLGGERCCSSGMSSGFLKEASTCRIVRPHRPASPPPQAQDIPDSEPPRESVAPGRGARQQRVHRNDERHTTRWRRVATVGEHRAARTRSVYSLSLSNPDATELGTPWPAAPLATPGHQIRGRHAGTGVKHIG